MGKGVWKMPLKALALTFPNFLVELDLIYFDLSVCQRPCVCVFDFVMGWQNTTVRLCVVLWQRAKDRHENYFCSSI